MCICMSGWISAADSPKATEKAQPIQPRKPSSKKKPAPPGLDAKSLVEKCGIQVASLRLTADGNIIDFRYRVVDPDKAAPLADRKIKAYLLDQSSGMKFGVPSPPKVGALRQNTLKLTPGRIYFILFGNGGQIIKSGSKVSVIIGDFRAENLTVE